ncbi:MAG: V-type ATP synthase subunit F [Gemmatimonadota bacterium]|jgi:vacuolar-type H+-ATPase subunit F/Vma7
MSHVVGVVADPVVALGFRLAGLKPHVAESVEHASEHLDGMLREDRWGVILVQEDLMPAPEPASVTRSKSGLPILVPFPRPGKERPPGEAEAYVAELLRRAVGYRVRLR